MEKLDEKGFVFLDGTITGKIVLAKEEEAEIAKINQLSQMEMANLWRFALPGHPYFDATKPYYKIFADRFKRLGGFTPAISKAIGWE